eukprot:CAMPEP_0197857906 /NCGR_PEP_ID=MMETSP1438-20131217/31352_1 /TAXON_ID=1461541 /ORGANISM="Pterosperma sp., Strain CCMP1384" /LENGTH=119 /DNA_ID=CAMNT_0043473905 /DNA_START=137 /DNA_END=492 /DNA_ORIENTATION=-
MEHSDQGFDGRFGKDLRNVKLEKGRCSCDVTVHDGLANGYGTLHGGMIATLLDVVSSVALLTVADRSGVSLELNITYLGAVPIGDVIEVDAQVIKVGRSVGTIQIDVRNKKNNKICAVG